MVGKSWFHILFSAINFILYLVVIATWISMPEELTLNLSLSIFNVSLTMILLFMNRENLKKYYLSGQFKSFTNALISVFLVLAILGFINFLSYKNPSQWDVTKRSQNSLTDQSIQILESVKGDIKFTVFCRKPEYPQYKALLELYRLAKSEIKIEHVDVDLRPDLVSQYGIEKSGTILIEYKGRKQFLNGTINELKITNSLIKATRSDNPLVLFTKGHGELPLSSDGKQGGSHLRSLLKASSYLAREIDLKIASEIPKEAKVLVIWGPKDGFFDEELKVLKTYMDQGGHLMIALDPNWNEDRVSNLRSFLIEKGLMLKNNVVIDRIRHVKGSNGMVPLVVKFDKDHPITQGFEGQVFFPLVSSVVTETGTPSTPLAFSSPYPASWADNEPKDILKGKIGFKEGVDVKGPISVVQAFESEDGKNKIVAFGNSSFVHNSYQKFSKNMVFFLNSLSWLADEDRLISFNLPVVKDEPVFVAANQMALIFYFSVLFSPIVLFLAAFLVYRRRSRL